VVTSLLDGRYYHVDARSLPSLRIPFHCRIPFYPAHRPLSTFPPCFCVLASYTDSFRFPFLLFFLCLIGFLDQRREPIESALHERRSAGRKLSRFSDQRQQRPRHMRLFATKRYARARAQTGIRTHRKRHSFPVSPRRQRFCARA